MAGRIPQEILDEIMARADIEEVVGEYVPLKNRGRNAFGLCPFHQEDTPSFSVNREKQIYKCFGCGKGGNVINFIQEVEHLSFGEAARSLAERYHVAIPEQELSAEERARHAEREAMLAAHTLAQKFYAEQLPKNAAAQAYMKKRGISAEMAEKFGLGSAPEEDWQALFHTLSEAGYGEKTLIDCGLVSRSAKNGRCYDKFHGRLIFPICDARHSVVAFGGRAMGNEEPKYLNSQTTPIYNKSNLLYALDLAGDSIRREGCIIIMEGYMDVLAAHQFGVTNAVASLGTAFTEQHARLLSRYAPEPPAKLQVMLSFDGDAAGQKAARLSLEKLAGVEFLDPRVLVYPDNLDPDDFLRKYGLRGWERLLKKYCYPRLDYLLLRACEKRDLHNAADKGAIVSELIPALRRTKNSVEAASFITELSRKLHVSEEAIRADLARNSTDSSLRTLEDRLPQRGEKILRKGRITNRQLLLLALGNEAIWKKAKTELADDFPSSEEEAQLIEFVDQLAEAYDFRPSSLFNYLEEEKEGNRQFLLKLLQIEIPDGDPAQLSEEYIRIIGKHTREQRLARLQRRIVEAESSKEDVAALLAEKTRLTRELKGL